MALGTGPTEPHRKLWRLSRWHCRRCMGRGRGLEGARRALSAVKDGGEEQHVFGCCVCLFTGNILSPIHFHPQAWSEGAAQRGAEALTPDEKWDAGVALLEQWGDREAAQRCESRGERWEAMQRCGRRRVLGGGGGVPALLNWRGNLPPPPHTVPLPHPGKMPGGKSCRDPTSQHWPQGFSRRESLPAGPHINCFCRGSASLQILLHPHALCLPPFPSTPWGNYRLDGAPPRPQSPPFIPPPLQDPDGA